MANPAGNATTVNAPLLSVVDLGVRFRLHDRVVRAASGVTFDIGRGEIVAVVGESGSGKSVTALTAMRLLATPPAEVFSGRVLLDGEDLLSLPEPAMRAVRGKQIGMIFQNPFLALNPLISIGAQLVETARLHRGIGQRAARGIAEAMLNDLGVREPLRVMRGRPYQASGGINQRVVLALALLGEPALIIADEPTTMLDAITQSEILRLLLRLRAERGMSIWLITHDFGAVALMADRVLVMYAGSLVEAAGARTILSDPKHPYTAGLVSSVPPMDSSPRRLTQIPGEPPALHDLPAGCPFAPRCPRVMDVCRQQDPPSVALNDGTRVSCWLHAGEWG